MEPFDSFREMVAVQTTTTAIKWKGEWTLSMNGGRSVNRHRLMKTPQLSKPYEHMYTWKANRTQLSESQLNLKAIANKFGVDNTHNQGNKIVKKKFTGRKSILASYFIVPPPHHCDHATILSHGYLLLTIKPIYSREVYLTNEEMEKSKDD